jgi:hypothetical protein
MEDVMSETFSKIGVEVKCIGLQVLVGKMKGSYQISWETEIFSRVSLPFRLDSINERIILK